MATQSESVETDSPSVTASSPVTPSVLSQSQSLDSITSASASSGCGMGESVASITPTRRRYPAHLSHGSPPGTQRKRPNSGQYETMEDLLAAAGYSVTRVFTPETERVQGGGEGEGEGKVGDVGGGGVGALVAGWFAHILPATSAAPGSGSRSSSAKAPEVRVDVEEDAEANPFLRPSGGVGVGRYYPQATRSLRTHLISRTIRPQASRSTLHPHAQRSSTGTDEHTIKVPALRHTASAPSLPRVVSGRRRALPSAWREAGQEERNRVEKGWSGRFVVKESEARLKPRTGWFGTARPLANVSNSQNGRSQSSPTQTIRARSPIPVSTSTHLRAPIPALYRARSAPRPVRVHVPVPAPPVRPSPVVQPSVVVCRSASSLGSGSSVVTRASLGKGRDKSRSRVRGGADGEEEEEAGPVLAPEYTPTDGLPASPARPIVRAQRSTGFLRRKPSPPTSAPVEDEPDLASIINAFRPPSAPASPTRRQRSIRSLRALLKDPRFPDVPVVCVASPGTVCAGGPGRAVWMSGRGWEEEVGRKNVLGGR